MGYYINPCDMSKEEFLDRFAELELNPETFEFGGDRMLLCLFFNTSFNALGIGYTEEEVTHWLDTDFEDPRFRLYYTVPKACVLPFLPEWFH